MAMDDARSAPRPAMRGLRDRARSWLRPGSEPASAEASVASRRDELLRQIASIGPLRIDDVELPGCATPLRIMHTADFDRLLSNSVYDFEVDYMPYWAEIWPCGVALAGFVVREPRSEEH